MPLEMIAQARTKLGQLFGEAFAQKATDEFCLSYLHFPSPRRGIGRSEAFSMALEESSTIVASDVIIEFKDQPVHDGGSIAVAREIHQRVREILGQLPDWALNLESDLQKLEYSKKLKAYKEGALKSVQSVKAYLEKQIERSFVRESYSMDDQPFLTRLCWLNQTVRTIAKNQSLAEVVQDDNIVRLDVPRKLSREINVTGPLVAANQYRQRFNRSGKDILVGVIDSEIDINHPSLRDRVVQAKNFTKEPWGTPDSHGTAVAGIIGSNDENYIGIAPGVKFFNYKVLATDSSLDADDFEGAMAIQKALEDGIQIANCSWGAGLVGDEPGREAKACNTAWDLGMLIVKSAGNRGPGDRTLTRPAEARGIIVVGASGKDGQSVEDYSSRGPLPSGEFRPHLLAPGGSYTDKIISCNLSSGFGNVGMGTSYAAPHVTGLLALILEEQPHLSPDELRDFAIRICKQLNGFDANSQGKGFISLASLLS
jgi:serine protease AprX